MIALGDAYLGVKVGPKPRFDMRKHLGELANARAARRQAVAGGPIEARYDAAQTPDVMKNYWAAADSFDADSANSPTVRETLRIRSRYEAANNGYADGIAHTYATAVVGIGPKLRMQTLSPRFNQMVEREFALWAKSIGLRRKLWTMAHAKHVDGEGIAVARNNPNGKHAIKLDLQLHEAEQLATPQIPFTDPQYVDGIEFDQFGNPVTYDLLRVHPGASNQFANYSTEPERIPAKFVMHWFLMRRPGQHRGVPEMASTLNDGACFRRWREAVVQAAEAAADFAVMLETDMTPGDADPAAPFSAVDFQKGMIVANPMGWKAHQMKAEHPNSTYTEFHRSLVSGQARPKSMPYNVAACDSSSYNYASGRLDYAIWHGSLDVDREDGNDLVLDPLFDLWFDEAVRVYGWLGGDPNAISLAARAHSWDWPKHKAADIEAEANSIQTRVRSGQATLSGIYAANGDDFTDAIEVMASDYGVTVEQMRKILLNANFNPTNQQAGMEQAKAQQTQAEAAKTNAEKPAPNPAAQQESTAQ